MQRCDKNLPSAEAAAHSHLYSFLDLIKRANNRSDLLAAFHALPKFQSVVEPSQLFLLTQTFLQKLRPPIFGCISEGDFNMLFRDALLLHSPNPATSLWALISFLSQCDDSFQFNKCISLVAEVQRELLLNALANRPNLEDPYQFAFALSSFASRVYNFFHNSSVNQRPHFSTVCGVHSFLPQLTSADMLGRAAAIVVNFEENLFDVLLEVVENNSAVNIPMLSHILTEYGAAAAGGEEVVPIRDGAARILAHKFGGTHLAGDGLFIRRFISAALCLPGIHSVFHQIFASSNSGGEFSRRTTAESRRNWEALLLHFVTMAPDGRCLQLTFGDSVASDTSLRHFLTDRAALVMPFSVDRRPRNSEKVADCLASCAPSHLVEAFQTHLQRFEDRCKVADMTSLHSHFAQALTVVDFARRLNHGQRCSIRDQLMYSLVPIVPQMIELIDCSRRQIGMLMAQELFGLFDFPSPPQFDYVQSDPMLGEWRTALQQHDQQSQQQTKNGHNTPLTTANAHDDSRRKQRCGAAAVAADARVAHLLDSDDDDEAEETVDQEMGPSSSGKLFYLRDCLQILSSAANDQSVKMCHWVEALRTLPQLLRKQSVGWVTLGEELLETMCQLDNRYNVPDFIELRAKTLTYLLALRPELVSNVFRKITARHCPIAQRFLLLNAVVGAAKLLANGEENEDAAEIPTKIVKQKMNFDGDKKMCKEIRRLTVVQKKEEDMLHENGFLRVAPQFVFPLLNVNQFEHFYGDTQSNLFLGKLALALGELVSCAAHAPSILSILSASFAWLAIFRRVGWAPSAAAHPFVRRCCICAYLAICDSKWLSSELLREHFANELRDCHEWLEEETITDCTTTGELVEDDETSQRCIGLLSLKIANILNAH